MARKLLKRLLPDPHRIRDHVHLRRFGNRLHDPLLWHLSRRSVPGAFSIGLFVAFIPLPFQMVIAAAMAIAARVNLPLSIALVWVTNPFTMPPLLYFAYKVGARLLSAPARAIHIEPTLDWLVSELQAVWAPLLLGCLVCGLTAAVFGNLFIRGFWRCHVARQWQARKLRMAQRRSARSSAVFLK